MTIREHLSKKREKILIISLIFIPPFLIFFSKKIDSSWLYLFSCILLCFFEFYIINRFVRCPVCNAKIGLILFKGRDLLKISDTVKECPSCRVSFDQSIESDPDITPQNRQ